MSEFLLQQIGERIKERRKEMYYTQSSLAEKTGLTSQTIASAEHGSKELRMANLVSICQALEVSADYLLFGRSAPLDQYLCMEKASRLPQEQRRHLENIINSFIAAMEAANREEEDTDDSIHLMTEGKK